MKRSALGCCVLSLSLSLSILAAGCAEEAPGEPPLRARWYTDDQVVLGRVVFQVHCASCHGERAEATPDWRKTGGDGHYPPPPLNGTAHGWHHSLGVLKQTIQEGGAASGGVMPPFRDVLSDEESVAAIAYFQSFWSDQIYGRWRQIDAG